MEATNKSLKDTMQNAEAIINETKLYNNFVDSNKSTNENINIFKMRIQSAPVLKHNVKKYSNTRYSKLTEEEKHSFMAMLNAMQMHFICDNVKSHNGDMYMFSDIWNMLSDEQYNYIAKKNRKLIFPTASHHRVQGDEAFGCWTGLQIIDLDIKNEFTASIIKEMLFDILSKYHWFLGITLSSSHSGLHIYTKIDLRTYELASRKIEYYTNFQQKYTAVFSALECVSTQLSNSYVYEIDSKEISFTNMIHWIDTAMCRPQQGAFIPFDPEAELSTNFINESIGYEFTSDDNMKIENAITSDPRLKEIFNRIKYFSDDNEEKSVNVEDIDFNTDVDTSSFNKKHYKYNERWQLANTLVQLYGQSNALVYLKSICTGTPIDELRGYINTATSHNKQVSTWAINELRTRHGFNINIKSNNTDIICNTNDTENINTSPVEQLSEISNKIVLKLKQGQYLSDIQNDILSNMEDITILDAGAGFGKTEMVKRIGGRKILVLPYTSIIESKIKADDEIKNDWLCFYSCEKVTPNDLFCSDKSFVMTIDKFSRLNIEDIKTAGFDTIWVDESHLLFISAFRSVMSDAIERLAQLPARGIKVVLMTGTPTAENLFFPNQKYIKVERELDNRIKEVNINFSYKKTESDYHMCQAMADCIESGKRILYPTNNGNRRFKQITSVVQEILNERHFGRKINTFYYKKSNAGTKSMKDINESKTVGENDIVGCTSFLSVGVDICDNFDFQVFFDTLDMPQDVEQFANRIRNNNLFINIYLYEYNADNSIIDYSSNKDIDFTIPYSDRVAAYNMIQLCNDQLKRCGNDMSYNSIVNSIVYENKYIIFDEDIPEYRIDWTSYLLAMFENRYKEYSTQMPCFIKSMKYYGYTVNINNNTEHFNESKRDSINEMLNEVKNICVSEFTTATFDLLDSLDANNIEIYTEGIKDSNYDIFRSAACETDRINNNIKCTNVEVIIKNMPMINRMYNWYNFDVIKSIYTDNTNTSTNKINIKKIKKICDYIFIETKRMQKRLDVSDYSFIMASREFALLNPTVKKTDLDNFISTQVCRALNRIDKIITFNPDYTENIIYKGSIDFAKNVKKQYEKLFNIYIEKVKSSRKAGTVTIRPFQPNYDTKESFNEMFGDINIKLIMHDEFTHRMRGISIENDSDDTDINNISSKTKLNIDNYNNQIVNAEYLSELPDQFIVPVTNNYYDYAEANGSAERFREKQARQHNGASDIYNTTSINNNENNDIMLNKNKNEYSLFDNMFDTISTGIVETTKQHNNITNNINNKTTSSSYNTEEDIEIGVDWDIIDELGLLSDEAWN